VAEFPTMFTASDLMRMLRIGPTTFYRLREDFKLKSCTLIRARRTRGAVRYSPAAVQEWLQAMGVSSSDLFACAAQKVPSRSQASRERQEAEDWERAESLIARERQSRVGSVSASSGRRGRAAPRSPRLVVQHQNTAE